MQSLNPQEKNARGKEGQTARQHNRLTNLSTSPTVIGQTPAPPFLAKQSKEPHTAKVKEKKELIQKANGSSDRLEKEDNHEQQEQ